MNVPSSFVLWSLLLLPLVACGRGQNAHRQEQTEVVPPAATVVPPAVTVVPPAVTVVPPIATVVPPDATVVPPPVDPPVMPSVPIHVCPGRTDNVVVLTFDDGPSPHTD